MSSELQEMVKEAMEEETKKGRRKRAQVKAKEPEKTETKEAVAGDDKAAVEEDTEQRAAPPAEDAATMAALVLQLTEKIQELESRLQPKAAPVAHAPNPARKKRRHIMVWKDEFTMIRVEVPDDYDGPGADGTPVKGYLNYEHSQLRR